MRPGGLEPNFTLALAACGLGPVVLRACVDRAIRSPEILRCATSISAAVDKSS